MLKFAVPGTPHSTPSPCGTLQGLDQTKKLGLYAMEIEWVQRVPSNVEHITTVGQKAKDLGITLTVHAPYFVNLNAKEMEKLRASKKRILHALTMAEICGAVSVCVHPAFYLGMDEDEVFENVREATADIMKHKEVYFPHVNLAFETMGKQTQFGTLEEVLKLSKEFSIYPCVDSAHLHARYNGAINTEKEWNEMFDLYAQYLGEESLQAMHLHYSGIQYGLKGERKHLPLKESDANWKGFINVLKQRNIGGVCVCESPLQEEDTLLMQREYAKLS